MLMNTKGGVSMASRAIRLLLLAIAIELFAVVFAFSPFANLPILLVPYSGRLLAFVIGVIGLGVALVGFSARD
jgi:hypothetical protein